MIDKQFLGMLVCPSTRKPLRESTAAELAAVNAAIQRGAARNRGGAAVAVAWTAALATEDGAWLYPIQDGIPILLTAEAVPAGG
ncbi:MAG: hypothetical protein FJ306_03270 [Planctomycetes bacterium]|nr:hypothetical protein [Planctomycetota bacterium]